MGWSEWKSFGSMSLLKSVSYSNGYGYVGTSFSFDLSDIAGYQNFVLYENLFPIITRHVSQNYTKNGAGTDPGYHTWSYNNTTGILTFTWNVSSYSNYKTFVFEANIYGLT